MAVDIYQGVTWGVKKQTISAGNGITLPTLSSAQSTDLNTVVLTFSTEMADNEALLDPAAYTIEEVVTLVDLYVLRVKKIGATTVELTTSDQRSVQHRVTVRVSGVKDIYGAQLNGASNTALFVGTDPAYPASTTIHSFFGLESGVQTQQTEDFQPDLDTDPPEIRDELPKDGYTQVDRDTLISIGLIDAQNEVIGSSVSVFVSGYLAYDGLTDTFFAPYDGVLSSFDPENIDGYDGYRIVIERTDDYPSYFLASIRVLADDNDGNGLDQTYSFRIEDYEVPLLANRSPAPGATDVDEETLIVLDVYDVGSGVDPSTVTISVDGDLAYDSGAFVSPFDGGSSSFVATMVDGYDGYRVTIDKTGQYPSGEEITIIVDALDQEGN